MNPCANCGEPCDADGQPCPLCEKARAIEGDRWSCPIERRVVVTVGSLDMTTGQYQQTGKQTEVRPCGTPLFGQKTVCNGCRDGWEVETNRPTARGRRQLAALVRGR